MKINLIINFKYLVKKYEKKFEDAIHTEQSNLH